jgi:hypothetical protein
VIVVKNRPPQYFPLILPFLSIKKNIFLKSRKTKKNLFLCFGDRLENKQQKMFAGAKYFFTFGKKLKIWA